MPEQKGLRPELVHWRQLLPTTDSRGSSQFSEVGGTGQLETTRDRKTAHTRCTVSTKTVASTNLSYEANCAQ